MGKKLLFILILVIFCFGCRAVPAETAPTPPASPAPTAVTLPSPSPSPSPSSSPVPEVTPEPTPQAFSIIWISDTQNMMRENAAPIHRMMEWIAANREPLNLRYVVHTGDIVGNGSVDANWELVAPAFQKLPKDLPLMTIAGNHDVGEQGAAEPYLRWRFDTALPADQLFGDGVGSYTTLETDLGNFLIVGMSMYITHEGFDWLNQVIARYPDHTCILALHDYLVSGKRHSSEGERVFERVVKENPNIRFVLCGHNRGVALKQDRLDDNGDRKADRIVYQMLHNFQDDTERTGYFRILTFQPDRSLQVTTYSPYLDDYNYYESRGTKDETFLIENAF